MNKEMEQKTVDILEMEAEVEEYYEAAGFVDFHNKVMREVNEEEIIAMHSQIFN